MGITQQQLGDLLAAQGKPRIGTGLSGKKQQSFSCTLPLPPSVNGLFAGKSRRYKSKTYKAWLEKAAFYLMTAPQWMMPEYRECFSGPLKVTYTFHFPADNRKRDIANYEKALSDFLVARGVIEDDSCIDEMILKRGCPVLPSNRNAPFVEIQLEVIP